MSAAPPIDYDALWRGPWRDAAARGPGFRSRYATLLRLMGTHGAAGRFVEFGAGVGAFLPIAAARFPWLEISAHDGSSAALEALRARPGLAAVYGGALDGALELGRAFDVIVCSEVLEHIDDHAAALAAVVRHLRPGGRLYLSVPLRRALWTQVDDAVGHVRRYERGELAGMCRGLGLQVLDDLSTGFPLYNAYYRALGRKSPEETAQDAPRGPLAGVATGLLAAALALETRVNTPLGGRGFVVARREIGRGSS